MARFDERVFKANDIRGPYPDQLNDGFAFLLGSALVEALGAKRIAVGYDCRLSSPSLSGALVAGAEASGAEIAVLGLCPGEHLYYLMGSRRDFDLGVMVTASHNPPQYNGFKVVGPDAEPIMEYNGLGAARQWIKGAPAPPERDFEAPRKSLCVEKDYVRYAVSVAGVPDPKALKVVADPGNGMGGLLWEELSAVTGIKPIRMNFKPDGHFPAHEPNPSKLENLLPLRDRVVREGANIGFAYDGDADRVVGVAANGRILHGSEMIVAVAEHMFEGQFSGQIAVNLVTSRTVIDFFRARGCEPVIAPVGHAKVKRLMRSDPTILFAGEQSGHYFYREFFCCESATITSLHLMHLAAAGRLLPLLESLPGPWLSLAKEPSFDFEEREEAVAACRATARRGIEMFPNAEEISCETRGEIKRHCDPSDIDEADGIRADYANWWFCVRPSETEPLARLTLEARNQTVLQEKLAALSKPHT